MTSNLNKKVFLCIIFISFLLSIEFFFRFLYIETDSMMVTLSSEKWTGKYYNYNKQHFRDGRDFSAVKPKDVFRIGILGDSFVKGQGIKDPSNRFSNILEDGIKRKFNINCEVYNLGNEGWDTSEERNFFLKDGIPYNLDILVISVLELDDFLDAMNVPELKNEYINIKDRDNITGRIIRLFVDNSYAISFFYAQFLKVREASAVKTMLSKASMAMANKDNWDVFMKYIFDIDKACRDNNIKFYLVSFPILDFDKNSDLMKLQAEYEKTFKFYLDKADIKHLFLREYFEEDKQEDLLVSSLDRHPNELANTIVAKGLLSLLEDNF